MRTALGIVSFPFAPLFSAKYQASLGTSYSATTSAPDFDDAELADQPR